MFKKIFINTFHREEEELTLHPPEKGFDLKTFIILFWVALGLTIIKYYGDPFFFASVIHGWGMTNLSDGIRAWADAGTNASLHHLAWWVGTMLFVYLFVPILLIKLLFKEELSNYGLKWKGAFKDWWLYVVMLTIMIPLVVYFSSTTSFQSRYPFYSPATHENLWPKFWIWELMYFAQFIGLEFFFRGFMTLGLRKRFGFYSIFIMTVPYCMIHFGKPMPETIGAIGAGLVLGTLSMKSRSIFLGVLIHYSIALAMDLCALWRKGFF